MANTTFNGTVRSESGLKVVSKNSTTGAYTDKMTFDSSGRMITTTGSHLKYTAATGYAASDFIVGTIKSDKKPSKLAEIAGVCRLKLFSE